MTVHRRVTVRNVFVMFVSCIAVVILLTAFDRLLGRVLGVSGYFKAGNPNVDVILDTKEFEVSVKTNADGLRNIPVGKKPDGTYRILALGDSFTFGWGVELSDSWPKQLEKLLIRDGKRVEVINAGVPGMDIVEEYHACLAYADRYDADMILIGQYSLLDVYQTARRIESGWPPLLYRLFPTLTRLRTPVIVDSQYDMKNFDKNKSVRTSTYWKEQNRQLLTADLSLVSRLDPEIQHDFIEGKLNPALFLFAKIDPSYYTAMLDGALRARGVSAVGETLRTLVTSCSRSRPTYLIFLPSFEMVDATAAHYQKGVGFATDERLLTLDVDPELSEMAKRAGARYVSLLTDFRSDKCPSCYYPWDSHLTPVGNARVAVSIAKAILPVLFK